jgi:hypothetical protein
VRLGLIHKPVFVVVLRGGSFYVFGIPKTWKRTLYALPYRAAGSFARNPIFRFLGVGGAMSSRIEHDLELSTVSIPGLACLLHFLRQDLIDERLIRQSLLLSGFAQPTQDLRI